MKTATVTATTTPTDLKTLMETADYGFSNDNDLCSGLIVQIDPDEATNSIDIMSEGETAGLTLSNADNAPSTISYRTDRVRRTYLASSASTVVVKVLIEQV